MRLKLTHHVSYFYDEYYDNSTFHMNTFSVSFIVAKG